MTWDHRFILEVTDGEYVGRFHMRLTFNDGMCKTVDLFPLLDGPIFAPLRDPAYFARGRMDTEAGTITWPNGADFAPEALWELPDISDPS